MTKEKGSTYLLFALCAFGILMSETLLAYGIEPLLYHAPMKDWNTTEFIMHLSVTCCTWLFFSVLIISFAKKKLGFYIWTKGKPVQKIQWLMIGIGVALCIVVSCIDWNGFKVLKEYRSLGFLKFAFQYMYYAVETFLFNLILIFGQKACELWFHRRNFPYGGVVVAATWGIGHFMTKDFLVGIVTIVAGLIFGGVYLLTNRDAKKTYLITFLMFVL